MANCSVEARMGPQARKRTLVALIRIAIPMCFSPHYQAINSILTLPRESIRSHTLRAQSYKTAPSPASDTNCESKLSSVLLTHRGS